MKRKEADIDQILVKGGLKHEHSMLEQLLEQLFFCLKKMGRKMWKDIRSYYMSFGKNSVIFDNLDLSELK